MILPKHPISYIVILALVTSGGYFLFRQQSTPNSPLLAQSTPTPKPTPEIIVQPQPVKALPGI
ncbi:hypothetical protein [Limnofasciculus baicalensis]|uniref:Uncharacterized protein n=1 Tax=Limnofasciculus baicalensis BBK-W-15 TaxID=2699891 RepID=A0AAE3GXS8_9CYAN|nr:hypothetical protein [Limnofasciculus baicalensis]MCP2731808.1 hypothetical protein [Limnofasciculus baicalensis BBK-W-15]